MSIEPMRQSTSLFERINEALEPIFLTQDQYDFLEMAISNWQDKEELINPSIDYDVDPLELLQKLEHIVLTDQEES
jgi:hypothetical protein